MKTAELLERRRQGWQELDRLCESLQNARFPFFGNAAMVARFSALYRAACTDLAMSDQLQLPPMTVDYLHRLVGRAHSQLYRSRQFPVQRWWRYIIHVAPRTIFDDPCVKVAFVLFFGLFTLSAILAWSEGTFPGFAESVIGAETIKTMETSFQSPLQGNIDHYIVASAGYIQHNTSIGLECFALGPLLLPSICKLGYNGVVLGASFGYMARSDVDAGKHFFEFVTAHGVFELTAIALSAAAGFRLGVGWLFTGGLSRLDSFRKNAERALPIIMTAVVLFILAAFTEGCISPSPLPYFIKALWAVGSASLLMFYFVVLGYPQGDDDFMAQESKDAF